MNEKIERIVELVKEELELRGIEAESVVVKDITKNNSVAKKALCITQKENGFAPCIYIDEALEIEKDEKELALKLVDLHLDAIKNAPSTIMDVKNIMTVENMRKLSRVKLVNYENNKEYLEDAVYVRFIDLAAVVYLDLSTIDSGATTVLFKNHLKYAGWDEGEDLVQIAIENTKRESGFEIRNMLEVLSSMFEGDDDTEYDEENFLERLKMGGPIMLVGSNKKKVFGSSIMLFPEYFENIAQCLDSDLYIIPSSIHEIIIIPENDTSVEALKSMIKEVNTTQVDDVEILGWEPYVYHKGGLNITEV